MEKYHDFFLQNFHLLFMVLDVKWKLTVHKIMLSATLTRKILQKLHHNKCQYECFRKPMSAYACIEC